VLRVANATYLGSRRYNVEYVDLMKVAIVIPCYNVAPYIRQTLESLSFQEIDWQAIIVDDGSTDGLTQQVREYLDRGPRIQILHQANRGVSAARNAGFKRLSETVQFQYVMFLDGDDMLPPGALVLMAAELEKHPDAGMVHVEPEFIDENGAVLSERKWLPRWTYGPRQLAASEGETPFESIYLLNGNWAMFRCSVYERTPGYDESFGQHFEDTDVFLQIAMRARVRYLPEKLYLYRQRPGQSTSRTDYHQLQLEKLYAKWRSMSGLNLEQRAIVRRAEDFRTGQLAAHIGFEAARRHYRDGKWMTAFRFWQGAVRRSIAFRF
jgi:glycosyltransferase involved in cell wall biosynthesis